MCCLRTCDIIHAIPVCHPNAIFPLAVLCYILLAILPYLSHSFLWQQGNLRSAMLLQDMVGTTYVVSEIIPVSVLLLLCSRPRN